MIVRKRPDVSLKAKYGQVIRLGLIAALGLNIVIVLAVPRVPAQHTEIEQPSVEIETVDIPETEQFEKPPAPKRPTVPVASDQEDIPEDITIGETTFEEFQAAAAPPPAPEAGPTMKFVAYDKPPELIGGMAAFKRLVKYPDIAREAGVTGTVFLKLFINKQGRVTDVVVMKGMPKTGLNEAAVEAAKKTHWKPAQQRDRAVGVWYAFPVTFQLRNG